MAFLFEYRSRLLRNYQSSYNSGRAFHLLSLYYLAIPFYEHALEDPAMEYSMEAAYNLAMIYIVIGSPHLAQSILKKYWTIQ
jgi:general transcription factor 3C polypeptide 3 (transcription factor C subunit 4)